MLRSTAASTMKTLFLLCYSLCCCVIPAVTFSTHTPLPSHHINSSSPTQRTMVSTSSSGSTSTPVGDDIEKLYNPQSRDEYYGVGSSFNAAQYLVDLHDAKATFNFCGGMLFQLILSPKLRNYLGEVAGENKLQVYDASQSRMFQIEKYDKSNYADNVRIFHGREVRKVKDAAGGMGFAIHLSMAGEDVKDPEGWTAGELGDYDGWAHDVGRTWRNAKDLASEGFDTYGQVFGSKAFGLHHRFYLHYDSANRVWLSAEDGCEGFPSPPPKGWNLMDAFKF